MSVEYAAFEGYGIEPPQIIDDDDVVARLEQLEHRVRADEAKSADDQHIDVPGSQGEAASAPAERPSEAAVVLEKSWLKRYRYTGAWPLCARLEAIMRAGPTCTRSPKMEHACLSRVPGVNL